MSIDPLTSLEASHNMIAHSNVGGHTTSALAFAGKPHVLVILFASCSCSSAGRLHDVDVMHRELKSYSICNNIKWFRFIYKYKIV
jgi:hypothetical protein